MKAQYIKELHSKGVYRSPFTKQKLECMKLVDVIQVLNFIEEQEEKGTVFKKTEWEYEFVKVVKKEKQIRNKTKKGKN